MIVNGNIYEQVKLFSTWIDICIVKKASRAVREVEQRMDGPVMMTVRLEASMPAVTCSAVEADPNPLRPGSPVTSLKNPILPAPPKEGGSDAARR